MPWRPLKSHDLPRESGTALPDALRQIARPLERWGNYVPTIMARRYDAFLYIDETHAVDPLHMPVHVDGEPPETYPSGV
ncbi:MAG: hypothetical protein ACM3SX_16075 [Deltaproteobacteria bacterium]